MKKIESLVTFRCNCDCIFCSLGDNVQRTEEERHHGTKTTKQIMEDVDLAKESGLEMISFSGGEPTIRKDIFRVATYAKNSGFKTIQIQTNGRMFYYEDFCKKSIESGINDYVISLHAHTAELHDKITKTQGCFKEVVQGIKNLKKLEQRIRINTVINSLNYEILPELTKFLISLDVNFISFIFITVEGSAAQKPKLIPKMKDVIPYLKRSFDMCNERNVQSFTYNIPLCLLDGYEKNYIELRQGDTKLLGPDFSISLADNKERLKIKSPKCNRCKYNNDCFGVWKNYAEIHGLDELKPV